MEGAHGEEVAYAAIKMGDRLIGAADRAASYPARRQKSGYTYYFPLDKSHLGQDFKVFLLGMKGGGNDLKPVVWLTAREIPFGEVK